MDEQTENQEQDVEKPIDPYLVKRKQEQSEQRKQYEGN